MLKGEAGTQVTTEYLESPTWFQYAKAPSPTHRSQPVNRVLSDCKLDLTAAVYEVEHPSLPAYPQHPPDFLIGGDDAVIAEVSCAG